MAFEPTGLASLSLVFPCYQEEGHLEACVVHVLQTLDLLKVNYEVIFVDDCSRDGTRVAIDRIIARHPDKPLYKVLHERNMGRGAAFMTGFGASTGEIVGFFDIDLEVSAVYLLEALRVLIADQADLVIGHRYYNINFKIFYRHLLSRCYRWLVASWLGVPLVHDTESGYKFFRRQALQRYSGGFHSPGWFWDTEVVTRFYRDGLRVRSFPCLFLRDGSKNSTVRPLRDSISYLRSLISFQRRLNREQ